MRKRYLPLMFAATLSLMFAATLSLMFAATLSLMFAATRSLMFAATPHEQHIIFTNNTSQSDVKDQKKLFASRSLSLSVNAPLLWARAN